MRNEQLEVKSGRKEGGERRIDIHRWNRNMERGLNPGDTRGFISFAAFNERN
jgi:hypothetical protein